MLFYKENCQEKENSSLTDESTGKRLWILTRQGSTKPDVELTI